MEVFRILFLDISYQKTELKDNKAQSESDQRIRGLENEI